MTQPAAIEALTASLLADLRAIHDELTAAIVALGQDWADLHAQARRRRLDALLAQVDAMMGQADSLAARHVLTATRTAYEVGAWSTALTAGVGVAFTQIDTDAITALAQDTMTDLLTATRGVREDVKDLVRELARGQVRSKLYTGQPATAAGRELARALADRGLAAVTYVDGRRVSLPVYADMVVRTKTAVAYQEGGFNQGERLGIDWWEVMDGPGCGWTSHEDPRVADGLIVSLEDARRHPTSHPNCRRATSPRPDIASARAAQSADPTRPTDTAVWEQAVAAQARATGTTGVSPSPRRTTTGVSTTAGTLPNTAAARRFAATLNRHRT